jgi:MarR family 2-MHQ and catechol resistance regulon transcriptional repressor
MDNSLSNNNQRLALSTFTKLIRAAETITTDVHAELTTHNLTISQFGVLEALHHLGAMCQRDIAKKILKSTGNITMVIDNLEKQKLVTRKRNEKDRRFFEIHLTAKGDALISDIFPAHAKRIVENMARLSKTEQLELGRLCRKFKNTEPDNKE